MGCSNPHPHGQVWSMSVIPTNPAKAIEAQRKYSLREDLAPSAAPKGPLGKPSLLLEYAHFEVNSVPIEDGRIIAKNDHWVALVPWWATWPFEVLREHNVRSIASTQLKAFQSRPTADTFRPFSISRRKRQQRLLPYFHISPNATTISSPALSPIRWASTSDPSHTTRILEFPRKKTSSVLPICTCISIHHFCEVLASGSSSSGGSERTTLKVVSHESVLVSS